MPVSANLLVLSQSEVDHIIRVLDDTDVAYKLADFDIVTKDPAAIENADIVIVHTGALNDTTRQVVEDLLNDKKRLLLVGENDWAGQVQSVPDNFCDLELKRRLSSLCRLDIMVQEFNRRLATTELYGLQETDIPSELQSEDKKSIMLIGNQGQILGDILLQLDKKSNIHICQNSDTAVDDLRSGDFDAVIILGAGQGDVHFRLCTDIRADSRLFNLPVLFILEHENDREAAYVHGASDIVVYPNEMDRLFARVVLHVNQSNYRYQLQKLFKASKPLPVTDSLTNLYSFGFVQAHLARLIDDHSNTGKHLTFAIISVNNLEEINNNSGYPAGDQVLRQIGNILAFLVRGEDFCGRYSGNKFIVALPSTGLEDARIALNRIYGVTRNTEFSVACQSEPINAFMHMGIVELKDGEDVAAVVKRSENSQFEDV